VTFRPVKRALEGRNSRKSQFRLVRTSGAGQRKTFSIAGWSISRGASPPTLAAPCSGKRMRKLARRRIEDGAKRLSGVKRGLRQRRDELLSRSEQIVRGAQKMFA